MVTGMYSIQAKVNVKHLQKVGKLNDKISLPLPVGNTQITVSVCISMATFSLWVKRYEYSVMTEIP